jgi:hypothetical protein
VGGFTSDVCNSGSCATLVAVPPDPRLRYRKKPTVHSIAIPPTAPTTIPPIVPPDSFDPSFCGGGVTEDVGKDVALDEPPVEFAQNSLTILFFSSTVTISEVFDPVFACQMENFPAYWLTSR